MNCRVSLLRFAHATNFRGLALRSKKLDFVLIGGVMSIVEVVMENIAVLFAICGIPIGIGLLVVFIVWGLRRSSMRSQRLESAIKMQNATFFKAEDGSLEFKPTPKIYQAVVLFCLGIGLICAGVPFLFLAWSKLTGINSEPLNIYEILISVIVFIGVPLLWIRALWVAFKSPRTHHLRFDATLNNIQTIDEPTSQPIPFSKITSMNIAVINNFKQSPAGIIAALVRGNATTFAGIHLTIEDGTVLELGRLLGDPHTTITRATAISKLITELTGAEVRIMKSP